MKMGRTAILIAAVLAGCGNPDAYYRHPDAGVVPVTTGAAGTGTGSSGAAGAVSTTGAAGRVGGAAGAPPSTTGAAGSPVSTTGAAGAPSTTGAAGAPAITGAAGSNLPAPDARSFNDFENGTATGWIADTVDGTWSVVADGTNKVYEQTMMSSSLSLAIGGKINWADQVIEMRVKFVSFSSTSALVYLAARYQNDDAYYFVALKADGSLKIRKRINGSTDDVATYKSNMPIVKDVWHTLGLAVVGTMLVAKYDGMPVAMGTATDLATGGIALGTQNAVAAFDDVRVTPP